MTGAAIDTLRRVAAALESGEAPAPGDAAWLASGVTRYVLGARDGLTLDRALGLSAEPGRRAWWTADARRARDEALRAVRRERFATLRISDAARRIMKLYPRNRDCAAGRSSHPLTAALESGVPLPGIRRLEDILRSEGN